jgi:hypothetical protein
MLNGIRNYMNFYNHYKKTNQMKKKAAIAATVVLLSLGATNAQAATTSEQDGYSLIALPFGAAGLAWNAGYWIVRWWNS